MEYLDKDNIRYFDFTKIFDPNKEKYKVPDGHPSAYANKILAEKICDQIKNLN